MKDLLQKPHTTTFDKVQVPVMGEIKYDGNRVVMTIHPEEGCRFRTYNGKEFAYPALAEAVLQEFVDRGMKLHETLYIDGEMCFNYPNGIGLCEHRHQLSGRINSAIHGNKILPGDNVIFVAFDMFTRSDLQVTKPTYMERRRILVEFIEHAEHCQPYLCFSDGRRLATIEAVSAYYTMLTEQGYEGIMLKKPTGIYRPGKRHRDWERIKLLDTIDMTVHSYNPGEGKYTGMVGSLVCGGTAENGVAVYAAVSGMTDAQRTIAYYEEHFKDKTIEVAYHQMSRTEDDEYTLIQPRFKGFRHDK